jgi:predicted AAA+ superfamily ATPase
VKRRLEEELIRWKNELKNRKPLLINGARQVGKTWLLKEFARNHYSNSVHVNLDLNQRVSAFFENSREPEYLIKMLEAEYQQRIEPKKTLLIIDEIQSSERALLSLKYFCEDAPHYHVAAAGSLLGVAVNREKYSFPVGKVHTLKLFPLDFEEYLWANGQEFLANEIRQAFHGLKPLPEGLHLSAIDSYRKYLAIGGMPSCINAFCAGTSLNEIPETQGEIVNNYLADMAKYSSASDAVKIRACYNSLATQLGKDNHKFQYKVVQKGGTSTIFGAAIEWLVLAGIALKCQRTEQGAQPITSNLDLSSFKLYMGDIGLLCMKAGVRLTDVVIGVPHHFQGALAENYVAQQLMATGHELFYWTSDNTAEVDFLVQTQNGVSAIEVKSATNTRSHSLRIFSDKFKPERTIRLSLKPFGSGGNITAVPLYATFCL